jgi:SlyX protein
MNTPSGSPSPDQVDERLTELEIKASFTEDWLEQLNQTIFRQQEQIDALIREISQLRQQMPEGNTVTHLRDELPPHY